MARSPGTPESSNPLKKQKTTSSTPLSLPKLEKESASMSKARLGSDLSLLESGAFADFTVLCGKQEWKAHRVILSRCPYFKPMVSENSAFKETRESSVTIEGFEPFEIEWLLRYIYSLEFDFEQAKSTSPNNSYLETCVLVWSLGDYFALQEVRELAMVRLSDRCTKHFFQSRRISANSPDISFLSDLEAGIRAAWRSDRATGSSQYLLMSVITSLQAYLRDQPSFISLLDELPEFTSQFVKALLGCPELQRITYNVPHLKCDNCPSIVFDKKRGEGKEFMEGAFIITPTSLNTRAGQRKAFCSQDCYDNCRKRVEKDLEEKFKEV